ncbi:TIGR03089 family protein [Epidermidibacterium keratini]|uniref:TIGR03089 family protein n=1 Tax=Epidermidibacterium keratini TaxID=1891644 RepID=A0A7L4YR58_9ACTN|nr:TIGR03089 family protein [Epidermidibacterium keratini]QHC01538.1 TIGR03089 family protein [Epidermidibacterium keratini]
MSAVPANLADALRTRIAADPAAPLITYYDQHTGERTELSGVTAENWVAKTANYLRDELMVEPGATVALALPPHWQTFAIVHAAWWVGAAVSEVQYAERPEVLFCGPDRMMEYADASADEIVATSLDPMGRALTPRPDHVRDYTSEVRLNGDQYAGPPPNPSLVAFRAGDLALDHPAALSAARDLAAGAGVQAGDRILADARSIGEGSVLAWALLPVVAGGSLVLVRPHNDADAGDWVERIAEQERITRTIGNL